MRYLMLLAVCVLGLSGCAATRSQIVASWEPAPGARVAYMVEIGGSELRQE